MAMKRSASRRVHSERLKARFLPLRLCPARHLQPSAMLATIKRLSRHKRGPCPIYSTVRLTVAARGAVRKASGRGTSIGRDGSPRPCRGRRTGNRGIN